MKKASTGDKVKVHYSGKLDDGTEFDSSLNREPLEFKIGDGQLLPAFEEAVAGLAKGEITTAKIPAEKAYGPHHPEMISKVKREELPEDLDPKAGDRLEAHHKDGQITMVLITEVADDAVTVDANHPLAGKDLTFEIKLLSIE